jgi:hypothetical protein
VFVFTVFLIWIIISDCYRSIFCSDFIVFECPIILILAFLFPFLTCQENMKTEIIWVFFLPFPTIFISKASAAAGPNGGQRRASPPTESHALRTWWNRVRPFSPLRHLLQQVLMVDNGGWAHQLNPMPCEHGGIEHDTIHWLTADNRKRERESIPMWRTRALNRNYPEDIPFERYVTLWSANISCFSYRLGAHVLPRSICL